MCLLPQFITTTTQISWLRYLYILQILQLAIKAWLMSDVLVSKIATFWVLFQQMRIQNPEKHLRKDFT